MAGLSYRKYCKYTGETVDLCKGIVICNRDNSVRIIGKGCGVKCPHFKLTIKERLRRWLMGWP